MFAVTKVSLSQQNFCRSKIMFVVTNISCDKSRCNKNTFVATKVLSQQEYFCHDKSHVLSWQTTNTFVATKIILVAAPSNDTKQHAREMIPMLLLRLPSIANLLTTSVITYLVTYTAVPSTWPEPASASPFRWRCWHPAHKHIKWVESRYSGAPCLPTCCLCHVDDVTQIPTAPLQLAWPQLGKINSRTAPAFIPLHKLPLY